MKKLIFWKSYVASRYKGFLLFVFLIWSFWTFGLGFIGGWFLNKGALDKFPEVKSSDRVLILAPHIDDETIGAAGIIQRAIKAEAKVKIVYLTNGDDNLWSVVEEGKTAKISPEEFVALGEQRMEEGKAATKLLGVEEKNLIFLGFPDRGLLPMLGKNFNSDKPYVSGATKFNHSPYRGTYKQGEVYSGENVTADLEEIIGEFQPTLIVASHPRDQHPDHRATYYFLERALKESKNSLKVFAYLVHFSLYPSEKKLKPSQYLYPPRKLFAREGWFSFELSGEEEDRKLIALKGYKSQQSPTKFYDFLGSFVKRNEIFEEY